MQIIREHTVDEIIGDVKTNKFKIGEDSMGIIIDSLINLYSDPIGSIVREVTSNCYDAHREKDLKVAGTIPMTNEDDPKWFHPQTKKPQIEFQGENVLLGVGNAFLFRDFGVGLSKKRVEEIYTLFGNSTKRSDNNQIGGFGIGAKSPFSYTDTFYIISKHNGKTFNYMLYRGNDAFHMDLLKEGVTTELNSTEVIIPLDKEESYRDIKNFAKAINNQLMYFEDLEFINVSEGGGREIKKAHIDYEDDELIIDLSQQHSYELKELHLIVGRVRYPLNVSMFENSLWMNNDVPCGIKFEVGELDLVPSREAIRYTDKTKNAILKKVSKIKSLLKMECEAELADTRNMVTWLTQASALKANSSRYGRSEFDSIFGVKSYLAELKGSNIKCELHDQTLSCSLLNDEHRTNLLFNGFTIHKVRRETSLNYVGGFRLVKSTPGTKDLITLPMFFQQQGDPTSEDPEVKRKVFTKAKDLFILHDKCPDGFIQIRRAYSTPLDEKANLFNQDTHRTPETIESDFNAMSVLFSKVQMIDYDGVAVTNDDYLDTVGDFESDAEKRRRLGKAFMRRAYFKDKWDDAVVQFSNSEYFISDLVKYQEEGGILIYGVSEDTELLRSITAICKQAGKYKKCYATNDIGITDHPVVILKVAAVLVKQLKEAKFIHVKDLFTMKHSFLRNWNTARKTKSLTDELYFYSFFEKLNSDLYYKWRKLKENHEENYREHAHITKAGALLLEKMCDENDCINHMMLSHLRELSKYSDGLGLLRHLEFSQLDSTSSSKIPSKEVFLAIREYLRFKGKTVVKFKKQKKKVEKISTNNN
tara:strand:- start:9401 stop:11845 length:2445 start_codon:yes stop_codon:yes gene_type:complete